MNDEIVEEAHRDLARRSEGMPDAHLLANRGYGRPRVPVRWGRGLVAATYGGGVGAFLSIAHKALT